MNIELINFLTILSVIIALIFLVNTILEAHKNKKEQEDLIVKRREMLSDYDKIIHSTYGVENAREKNKGVHFDDEIVYLNRAKAIREDSSLFSWINEC